MREIKFRAWDKKKGRLLYDGDGEAGYQDGWWATDTEVANYMFKQDRYVWMQYTGLKDKNGVEIYEGDILRAWCDFYDNGLTETVVLVVWIDDLAIFTLGGWGDRSLAAFAGKEVIGNIWENPELLGQA